MTFGSASAPSSPPTFHRSSRTENFWSMTSSSPGVHRRALSRRSDATLRVMSKVAARHLWHHQHEPRSIASTSSHCSGLTSHRSFGILMWPWCPGQEGEGSTSCDSLFISVPHATHCILRATFFFPLRTELCISDSPHSGQAGMPSSPLSLLHVAHQTVQRPAFAPSRRTSTVPSRGSYRPPMWKHDGSPGVSLSVVPATRPVRLLSRCFRIFRFSSLYGSDLCSAFSASSARGVSRVPLLAASFLPLPARLRFAPSAPSPSSLLTSRPTAESTTERSSERLSPNSWSFGSLCDMSELRDTCVAAFVDATPSSTDDSPLRSLSAPKSLSSPSFVAFAPSFVSIRTLLRRSSAPVAGAFSAFFSFAMLELTSCSSVRSCSCTEKSAAASCPCSTSSHCEGRMPGVLSGRMPAIV
eukprot:Rhum_TRINITY_DN15468_c1_g1::Rhum_TRINITY_DN15468_c1_g1_i1::g.158967::m.158967